MIYNDMKEFLNIISVYKSDISYIKYLKSPYVLYYKDSPQHDPFNNVNICGAETNVLKFIIDFYDNLPEICVFTHPYNNKWTHPGNLYDCINNLYSNRNLLGNFGPIHSLTPRYDLTSNLNVKYDYMQITNWWKLTMEPYFGEMPKNFALNKFAGAQFYVRKKTIKRLPIEFYKNMYNFLIEKSIPDSLYKTDNPYNQFWLSRFMEWSWEFIFSYDLLNK